MDTRGTAAAANIGKTFNSEQPTSDHRFISRQNIFKTDMLTVSLKSYKGGKKRKSQKRYSHSCYHTTAALSHCLLSCLPLLRQYYPTNFMHMSRIGVRLWLSFMDTVPVSSRSLERRRWWQGRRWRGIRCVDINVDVAHEFHSSVDINVNWARAAIVLSKKAAPLPHCMPTIVRQADKEANSKQPDNQQPTAKSRMDRQMDGHKVGSIERIAAVSYDIISG